MGERTIQDLWQLQGLPLNLKIRMTKDRIRQWIQTYGEDGVYVSFSGGKDSTVLLHLVREEYPNVKAVFVDTGLEYPEIRQYVKTFDNVEWLKPKMNFKQVIQKYGYPFPSKEVAQTLYECKVKISKGGVPTSYRMKKLNGEAIDKKTGLKSQYNIPQYKFFLEAPFFVSHMCCNIMKKKPAHNYFEHTKRTPMLGQMASESKLRTQHWLKHGCNGFDLDIPTSNPIAFWTEQDVLLYIYQTKLPICSVYGEVVKDQGAIDGQMDLEDYFGKELFNLERPLLKTTGCSRTGCMFCGFGCHLEKPGEGRFERMKVTHPKQYDYIMRPWEQGGLNYKEVIDWINEHGNMNIKY